MNTVLFGLDSTGAVPAAAHHAVGSTVAIRYLSRSSYKVVTAREYQNYRANGIHLCTVFEDGASNALLGYDQGKSDGEWALKQATAIGMPRGGRCTFAYDDDPRGREWQTDAYSDGVAAVWTRERSGLYGGASLMAHCHARGFRTLFGTYAWSDGRVFPAVNLQQYSNDHYVAGVNVDFDHAFPGVNGDFSQWDYVSAPPKPPDAYHIYPGVNDKFAWKGKMLYEGRWVRRYDHLRDRPFPLIVAHRRELATLRAGLRECADRIYYEAHLAQNLGEFNLPPRWGWNHLGARYQGCIKRAQGERVL